MSIPNKIDFAVILTVKNANPNGDPLNGNRPRTTIDGIGEISDVCIKRKLRNKLMDLGAKIFVQSDDRHAADDKCKTLKERAEKVISKITDSNQIAQTACNEWYDVRAFGQVFAFKSDNGKKGKKVEKEQEDGDDNSKSLSVGIRGSISIHPAFSVQVVNVTSMQITKSVSNEGSGTKKSSDTMGMKHRVDFGVYVFYGAINPQLADKTGFSEADVELFKRALPLIFEGDASSARPEGSMEVKNVFWWEQPLGCDKQYSSAKVHHSLTVHPDGSYELADLGDLKPEIIEGF